MHVGATALSRATFGQGSGQIWLDDVRCTSNERRLIECPASNIGSHNCAHSEDAGVRCTAPTCMTMLHKLQEYINTMHDIDVA